MRHRIAGRSLSRSSSHRGALLRNQVTALLEHGRIVTTEAKAREVRPMAEKVITLGKRGSLHARRQAAAVLYDGKVLRRVFDELATQYRDRPGGYTRIVKLGPRLGDGARMAQIELVEAGTAVAPAATAPTAAASTAPTAAASTAPARRRRRTTTPAVTAGSDDLGTTPESADAVVDDAEPNVDESEGAVEVNDAAPTEDAQAEAAKDEEEA